MTVFRAGFTERRVNRLPGSIIVVRRPGWTATYALAITLAGLVCYVVVQVPYRQLEAFDGTLSPSSGNYYQSTIPRSPGTRVRGGSQCHDPEGRNPYSLNQCKPRRLSRIHFRIALLAESPRPLPKQTGRCSLSFVIPDFAFHVGTISASPERLSSSSQFGYNPRYIDMFADLDMTEFASAYFGAALWTKRIPVHAACPAVYGSLYERIL